jgi:hypothetical protein
MRQTRARMEEAFISLIQREAAENGMTLHPETEVAHDE